MSTNQQIEKIRSKTVEKLFGSHHKILVFLLTVKTQKQFLEKEGSSVDQSRNLKLGQQ